MRKDLKKLIDSIDSIEEKETSTSDYEQEIKHLKDEVRKLGFTISEQKKLIREQENKLLKSEDIDIPGDIQILKDMLISQRQDLKKKEKDIEILEQRIEELKEELNKSKTDGDKDISNEELINAKKLIVQLTDENEMYKQNEDNAKILIKKLTEENETYRLDNENLKEQFQNLESETFKKLELDTTESISEKQVVPAGQLDEIIGKLEEENNKLKKDLDTANITINNLVEEVKSHLKDISDQDKEIREKNVKISALTEKFESAKRRYIELQKQIEDFSNLPNLPNEKFESYELKLQESEKIVRNLKAENEHLILKLENKTSLEYNFIVDQCAPKYYQSMLFMRLFNSLDKYKKELIIDSLIQDLVNSQSLDMKRYIIDILSEIKDDQKVCDTLIEMINNEDWLIRLHLVKALSKFDTKEIKDSLEQLLNDPDLDVREAAYKALKKISE